MLRSVTLAIPNGCLTVVVGESGAGKSSLLRLLNRLDEPCRGTIRFDGRDLPDYPVRTLRRRVGFVFQTPVMFAGSVEANLKVAGELAGLSGPETIERARRALVATGLDAEVAARDGSQLSVGQQQRVNLARALVGAPDVLVLDEPTSSLDPESARRLLATLRAIKRDRALSIVMATHRLDEARAVADHVVMMDGGTVIETGDARMIWTGSRHPTTRRFLTGGEGRTSP